MQQNPTVTAADIARLAGVGRAAVSNWRRRHADFPAPVGGTATSPEFDLREVEEWLRAQGKLTHVSKEDRLWQHLLAADEDPYETLGTIGAYLLGIQRGEPRPANVDPRLAPVLDDVATLAGERGAQAVFDELWTRLVQWPGLRTNPTPDELADLMAGLADAAGGSVLDPACGGGGLLRAAARAGCTTAYGQELDPRLARVARLWLALRGIAGAVQTGDSLRDDAYVGQSVDTVLCAPPLGVSNWGQDDLAYDPRWVYGLPPRTEPELAWAQHALAHLRPGGAAVLLMPPTAARRRAGRRIRAELLRRGALRAVIALPAGVAARHRVPLQLWVLRRPEPDAPPPAQALLVDAATGDDDPTTRYARVLDAYRRFAADPERPIEEADFARAVPLIELLDEEVDLTPGRRQPAASAAETGQRLVRTRDELAALVAELPRLMPALREEPEPAEPATVSIAELAKAGALRIIGPVRPAVGEVDPADDRPVLTARDIVLGQAPSGRAEGRLHPEIEVRPGDVLVPMVAPRLAARVVTEPGALLGRYVYLLRPEPDALDPWFLAGQLLTSANERQTSTLSGNLRVDVRRAQVPRLPLPAQRQRGEAFRRLDAFDSALRRAAKLGAEFARTAADGLARGSVRVTDGDRGGG